MKAVMISIQPKWVEKIASREKTIEVRKTKPNLQTPFKCFIYQTIDGGAKGDIILSSGLQCGKVIGEFICDEVYTIESEFWDNFTHEQLRQKYKPCDFDEYGEYEYDYFAEDGEENWFNKNACLSWEELRKYIGRGIKEFYGLHISNLKIYDKPKELSEFKGYCKYQKFLDGSDNKHCSNCVNQEGYISYPQKTVFYCDKRLYRPSQSWCYVEV